MIIDIADTYFTVQSILNLPCQFSTWKKNALKKIRAIGNGYLFIINITIIIIVTIG